MGTLSSEEITYYDRQIILSSFNIISQEKLKAAKVLVIGAGGLGSAALLYLAGAGIGEIGIVDFDKVDISNLHRQLIYDINDIGKSKAETAKEKLVLKNPNIIINSTCQRFNSENAFDLVVGYDIIIDCSDNFMTRYLINDICIKTDKTFISGSVYEYTGSIAVFNFIIDKENRSATYRCLFPQAPSADDSPDCNSIGIIGVIPGMIGNMMAWEVIKIITRIGKPLANQYLSIDFANNKFNIFNFKKDEIEVNKIKKSPLEDDVWYEDFCQSKSQEKIFAKEISANELRQFQSNKEEFILIDVRESYEHELINIGGISVPLSEIQTRFYEIPRDKKVVMYCRMGSRSSEAIRYLQLHKNYSNLFSLKGGLRAYMNES
jgi:molybdopterin/thiamine biosynthesis adenylyltransferase/rhodanese-related sulfurtransferase